MANSKMDVDNPLVTQEDIKDHLGVGALVYNDIGKIIIFHHVKYNFWTIPIGKCDLDKDPVHQMTVELKEELGIDVHSNFLDKLGSFTKTYSRSKTIKTKIKQILYEVTEYHGIPKNMEPHKHDQMKWMYLRDLTLHHDYVLSDMLKYAILLDKDGERDR